MLRGARDAIKSIWSLYRPDYLGNGERWHHEIRLAVAENSRESNRLRTLIRELLDENDRLKSRARGERND